jgi:hypothetical protein
LNVVNSLDSAFFGAQKFGFVSQKLALSHRFCFGGFFEAHTWAAAVLVDELETAGSTLRE